MYQFQTIPDKLGIGWYQQYIKYHHQYNTSINMVLLQYSTEGFVSVWYHHSTDSGDFKKTVEADDVSDVY
jgi:hypothetical protein